MTPPEHPPSPFDSLRDRRAFVDTGAGPIAFVVVYAIFGLHTAAAVAVGIGIALAVERIVRGKPVINAVAGLFGTGLAAFIAVKSGKAETYFVPKLLQQLGLFVIFAGSVVIRRPLTGYIIAQFYRADPEWVKLAPVKRVMTEYTLVWAALFGCVSFEVFGQYGPDTLSDPAQAFDQQVRMALAVLRGSLDLA